MTVELIQMIADRNNLHDVDTWMIFKWVFKSAAAILIVTNTWNIVMGVFDMAQSVVAQAAGIIGSDASIDISVSPGGYENRGSWKWTWGRCSGCGSSRSLSASPCGRCISAFSSSFTGE